MFTVASATYKRLNRPVLRLTRSLSAVLSERLTSPRDLCCNLSHFPFKELVTECSRLAGWDAVSVARQSQTFSKIGTPPYSVCLDPDGGGNKLLRNAGNYLPIDTASYATWIQRCCDFNSREIIAIWFAARKVETAVYKGLLISP